MPFFGVEGWQVGVWQQGPFSIGNCQLQLGVAIQNWLGLLGFVHIFLGQPGGCGVHPHPDGGGFVHPGGDGGVHHGEVQHRQ